jgi:hypothetical protein
MSQSPGARITDGRWAAVLAGVLFAAAVVGLAMIALDYDADIARASGRDVDVGASMVAIGIAAAFPGGLIVLGAVRSGVPALIARIVAAGVLLLLVLLFAFAGGLFFAPAVGLMSLSALQLGLALLRRPPRPLPPPAPSQRMTGG